MKRYIFAGKVMYKDDKIGHHFILIDDNSDDGLYLKELYFLGKSNAYIGQIFEMMRTAENQFKQHETNEDYRKTNPEFVDKVIDDNLINIALIKNKQEINMLKKERESIENMTLKEIRAKIEKNWRYKYVIEHWLKEF
jgi:hypothetical protein